MLLAPLYSSLLVILSLNYDELTVVRMRFKVCLFSFCFKKLNNYYLRYLEIINRHCLILDTLQSIDKLFLHPYLPPKVRQTSSECSIVDRRHVM